MTSEQFVHYVVCRNCHRQVRVDPAVWCCQIYYSSTGPRLSTFELSSFREVHHDVSRG